MRIVRYLSNRLVGFNVLVHYFHRFNWNKSTVSQFQLKYCQNVIGFNNGYFNYDANDILLWKERTHYCFIVNIVKIIIDSLHQSLTYSLSRHPICLAASFFLLSLRLAFSIALCLFFALTLSPFLFSNLT